MSGWSSPDPWACDVCPESGLGGKAAKDAHIDAEHIARPRRLPGPVVPPGIPARQVRAWAKANGWPGLGQRGRLPQDAIDAYVSSHPKAHR